MVWKIAVLLLTITIFCTNPDISEARALYDIVPGEGGGGGGGVSPTITKYVGGLYEQEYRGNTLVSTTKHIFLGSQKIASIEHQGSSNEVRYYHTNHQGSTDTITNQDGQQIVHYEYEPYGQIVLAQGTEVAPYKFTGKPLDETGLYYFGARYYNPVIAKFITPDPTIQRPFDPQDLNRYAYCRNNPVNLVDPNGLSWWKNLLNNINNFIAGIFSWLEKVTGSPWSVDINIGYTVHTDTPLRTGGEIALYLPIAIFQGPYVWLFQEANNFNLITGEKTYDASDYQYGFFAGILNDKDAAFENARGVDALRVAESVGKNILVSQNPTNGAATDLVESILSKLFPFIGIKDRQLAGVMAEMRQSGKDVHLYFHSEGAIIGSNNLLYFGLSGGRLPKGSSVDFIGPPISWLRAQGAYSIAGGGGFVNYKADWRDLVTATGFPNPPHLAIGIISTMLYGLEPHSTYSYYGNEQKKN